MAWQVADMPPQGAKIGASSLPKSQFDAPKKQIMRRDVLGNSEICVGPHMVPDEHKVYAENMETKFVIMGGGGAEMGLEGFNKRIMILGFHQTFEILNNVE